MKTTLYALLLLAAFILPVCAIYWFMVRELLLAMFRGRLLRLFVELRAFAVHQPNKHPTQLEAIKGQIACRALVQRMRYLDMGDVFAESLFSHEESDPIACHPAIAECDADLLRSMRERFGQIAMAIVLINSPVWFPFVAMVYFGAQWSRAARRCTKAIHRGLMALVDLGNKPSTQLPVWV